MTDSTLDITLDIDTARTLLFALDDIIEMTPTHYKTSVECMKLCALYDALKAEVDRQTS